MDFDIVVMGSGAAGLTAALLAAKHGARVLVLEKSPLFGGTSAISGGQIWIPNSRFSADHGDSPELARTYLDQVTLGESDPELLQCFVEAAPRMVADVERLTGLSFAMVDRADYHSEWPGAVWGRSLEPAPVDSTKLGALASAIRRSPYRPPLTSAEIKRGADNQLAKERNRLGHVTQGVALMCGLAQGCVSLGVTLRSACSVYRISRSIGQTLEVHFESSARAGVARAKAVILASGGFEWNEEMKGAFLYCPDEGAASPPWNDGDGLRIGLAAGAAVANMTQAWWSAAFKVPGETYDNRPLVRNIVRELALPGSIVVNSAGRRFVNEASSYNALGKAFQVFDAQRNCFPNRRAWLIFDQAFKRRYPVASIPASDSAPDWFMTGRSLAELGSKTGIAVDGLQHTIERFNTMARAGRDQDFARGDAKHDHYHGDEALPNPNLGEISEPPFHAVPIFLGNLGTKGGLKTDRHGRVRAFTGGKLPGLFACGNVAASWMGPGYPGAGGSLGPIMTAAYVCGVAAANAALGA